MKKNKYEIDMCNGTIMDKLISFSVPLMVSGILQLLFNAVDIIVVGRFSGSWALAAVGSTTALINVFTNLFIGVSLGANVLAARFYAAGRDREMSETVHTAITFALISGVVMAFVGLICSRYALEIMGTPDDVIEQAVHSDTPSLQSPLPEARQTLLLQPQSLMSPDNYIYPSLPLHESEV